jgi:hypothetical protein
LVIVAAAEVVELLYIYKHGVSNQSRRTHLGRHDLVYLSAQLSSAQHLISSNAIFCHTTITTTVSSRILLRSTVQYSTVQSSSKKMLCWSRVCGRRRRSTVLVVNHGNNDDDYHNNMMPTTKMYPARPLFLSSCCVVVLSPPTAQANPTKQNKTMTVSDNDGEDNDEYVDKRGDTPNGTWRYGYSVVLPY